jgi:hypothetical protein
VKEQWKTIAGFEAYEVSDMGRVRRVVPDKFGRFGHVMKPATKRGGYLGLSLWQDRKYTNVQVHILVAKAFLLNPSNLPEVNHKDGIKTNIKASNLEWKTRAGNERHAVKLGLRGKGVHFESKGKWKAWRADYNPEPHRLKVIGYFKTKEEALAARKEVVEALPHIA